MASRNGDLRDICLLGWQQQMSNEGLETAHTYFLTHLGAEKSEIKVLSALGEDPYLATSLRGSKCSGLWMQPGCQSLPILGLCTHDGENNSERPEC